MIYRPNVVGNAERLQVARQLSLLVRVSGEPTAILAVIRREVRALNPRIPISTPRTMSEILRRATARTSFTVAMLGVASGIALLLGMIGIYGVISYVVSQRTREIGVRMALGASAPTVRRMVVGQGMALAGMGVLAGLVGAWLMSSVMTSLSDHLCVGCSRPVLGSRDRQLAAGPAGGRGGPVQRVASGLTGRPLFTKSGRLRPTRSSQAISALLSRPSTRPSSPSPLVSA